MTYYQLSNEECMQLAVNNWIPFPKKAFSVQFTELPFALRGRKKERKIHGHLAFGCSWSYSSRTNPKSTNSFRSHSFLLKINLSIQNRYSHTQGREIMMCQVNYEYRSTFPFFPLFPLRCCSSSEQNRKNGITLYTLEWSTISTNRLLLSISLLKPPSPTLSVYFTTI